MRVALIYDRVNKIGGAERVLTVLHEIYPHAPLYTSLCDLAKAPWAKDFHVITSFLQRVKFLPHEILPNLMPLAFHSFDFSEYGVVISVASAESKYINVGKKTTKHICYCLTPTRYLWSGYFDYLKNPGFEKINFLIRFIFIIFAPFMRMHDFEEAQKADKFIAISEEVKIRIRKYYRRQARMVYPPINLGRIEAIGEIRKIGALGNDYFLIVSRLVPYKQIDFAIHVFNEIGKTLVIVGAGSDASRLKRMAHDNIIFTGSISDAELSKLYNNCTALIYPGVEDFGLTALEAQSFNKPVICNAKGGTRETVIIGKTGEVFGNEDELKRIIFTFDKNKYKQKDFQNNLLRFSKEKFRRDFEKEVV